MHANLLGNDFGIMVKDKQEKRDMATPAEIAMQAAGASMCKGILNQALNSAKTQLTQIETKFTRDGVVLALGVDAELAAYESALLALIAKVSPPAPAPVNK